MKRQLRLGFIVLISLAVTTGCWDRTELNDLALLLGWGMDYQNDGNYMASAQFVIPSQAQSGTQSGGAGNNQAYFTETGVGKDVTDAALDLQTKVSRRISPSHRKEIFLGEALAKHGLKDIMDEYTRNPDVRLRTDVFVVKGGTAKELLKIPQPLEKVPALAALKLHEQVGGIGDIALVTFLMDATTPGARATLPVMAMNRSITNQGQATTALAGGFSYAGRAVFNKDLKLIGYLNKDESKLSFWVKGALSFTKLTAFIPQGDGTVSLDLRRIGSRIKPVLNGNQIKFIVNLSGSGVILENNTKLDLSKNKDLLVVQKELNKQYEKEVKQVITKVQKKYKADIFGFGKTVHRKYPYKWKNLQDDWDETFSRADVVVKVNLKIKSTGLTGESFLKGTK